MVVSLRYTHQDVIFRLPLAAFADEKTQRLTPLLNKAKAVDKLITEGKLQEAIDKLVNDLRKHAETWFIEAPAQEGQSTKTELIRMIDALIKYLELVFVHP